MLSFRTAFCVFLLAGAACASAQTGPAPAPAQAAPQPPADISITPDEARQTATQLAALLEENYVFPDVAKRYAAMLRANAAGGAYDGFTSGRALAEKLTADLRAVSPDNHLRVRAGQPPAARGAPAQAAAAGAPQPQRRAYPFEPIEEARWLAPGIAYIRFNLFPGDAETVAAVDRFMKEHAAAKAIIFDNRTHHGGGLAEMNAMFPYLFARPTTLVRMDTRASVDRAGGNPVEEDSRLRLVPSRAEVVSRDHYVEPSKTQKSLFGAKVFVLTSGATASAAEHMTLSLKRTHRAVIVGETTAGAGNYGGQNPVGDKFSVFVPVGRTYDPDTGKGWEGSGIDPDVAVPADRALYEALVRSGVAAADAERIGGEVKPKGSMTRRTPRAG